MPLSRDTIWQMLKDMPQDAGDAVKGLANAMAARMTGTGGGGGGGGWGGDTPPPPSDPKHNLVGPSLVDDNGMINFGLPAWEDANLSQKAMKIATAPVKIGNAAVVGSYDAMKAVMDPVYNPAEYGLISDMSQMPETEEDYAKLAIKQKEFLDAAAGVAWDYAQFGLGANLAENAMRNGRRMRLHKKNQASMFVGENSGSFPGLLRDEMGMGPEDFKRSGQFQHPLDKARRTWIDDSTSVFDRKPLDDLDRLKMQGTVVNDKISVRGVNRKDPAIIKHSLIPDTLPLGQLWDHPELYNAYPDLAKTPVGFDYDLKPHQLGYVENSTGKLMLNPNIKDPKKLQSVLIHEVEHKIQDLEGWGRGGSSASAWIAKFPKDQQKKLAEGLNIGMKLRRTMDEQGVKANVLQAHADGKLADLGKKFGMTDDQINMLGHYIDEGRKIPANERFDWYEALSGEAEARLAQDIFDKPIGGSRSNGGIRQPDVKRLWKPDVPYSDQTLLDSDVDSIMRRSDSGRTYMEERPTDAPTRGSGAPAGMDTPEAAAANRERYLRMMEGGAEHRDWYNAAGENNMYLAGDDPAKAERFTAAQAITSTNTPVDHNYGYAIRGFNQHAAGMPVEGGRFSHQTPKLQAAFNSPDPIASIGGNKVGPYAENIALGGNFHRPPADSLIGHNGGPALNGPRRNRAVHDVWDMRAWGYDTDRQKGGASPSQHRWMDEQMDMVLAEANKRKLAGYDDWDNLKGQAATWTDARKAGGEPDIGANYPQYNDKYSAQGSWEAVPGRTTNHLPGLADAPMDVRNEHLNAIVDAIVDQKGRDRIAQGYGALTPQSFSGPGVFEGDINPGMQSPILAGRSLGGGSIDPASGQLLGDIEHTRALLLGQDAAAGHYAGNPGAPMKSTDLTEFSLGRTISDDDMRRVMGYMQKKYGDGWADKIALVSSRDGVRMKNISVFADKAKDRISPQDFVKMSRELGDQLGFDKPLQKVDLGPLYTYNNWKENPLGQVYIDKLNRPGMRERFNSFVPDLARSLEQNEAGFAKRFPNDASQISNLRKIIANEGWDGMMKAIKNGAVPVALVGMVLQSMGLGEEDQGRVDG